MVRPLNSFFREAELRDWTLVCTLGDPLLEGLTGFRLDIRLSYKKDRHHPPSTQPGLQLPVCKQVSLKCNLLPSSHVEAVIMINALITRSTLPLMNMRIHRAL